MPEILGVINQVQQAYLQQLPHLIIAVLVHNTITTSNAYDMVWRTLIITIATCFMLGELSFPTSGMFADMQGQHLPTGLWIIMFSGLARPRWKLWSGPSGIIRSWPMHRMEWDGRTLLSAWQPSLAPEGSCRKSCKAGRVRSCLTEAVWVSLNCTFRVDYANGVVLLTGVTYVQLSSVFPCQFSETFSRSITDQQRYHSCLLGYPARTEHRPYTPLSPKLCESWLVTTSCVQSC